MSSPSLSRGIRSVRGVYALFVMGGICSVRGVHAIAKEGICSVRGVHAVALFVMLRLGGYMPALSSSR